jgi:hypothetical protein
MSRKRIKSYNVRKGTEMKYTSDFADNALIMADDKGNKTSFEYIGAVPEPEAIGTLLQEMKGRGNVTAAALSLMVQIMDNPRLGTYAGKIPMGEKMDAKFKSAIREEEEAHLKPLFIASYDAKHKAQAKAASTDPVNPYHAQRLSAWDTFIGDLRKGGIYGNVKSTSTQYLGYFGKLPCVYDGEHPDKARLLAVSAMQKLIANAKADATDRVERTVANDLVKLSSELQNRNDKTKLGSPATAIAALKAMLATFEGLQQEEAERATENNSGAVHKDVSRLSEAAIKQAQAPKEGKAQRRVAGKARETETA